MLYYHICYMQSFYFVTISELMSSSWYILRLSAPMHMLASYGFVDAFSSGLLITVYVLYYMPLNHNILRNKLQIVPFNQMRLLMLQLCLPLNFQICNTIKNISYCCVVFITQSLCTVSQTDDADQQRKKLNGSLVMHWRTRACMLIWLI